MNKKRKAASFIYVSVGLAKIGGMLTATRLRFIST